VGFFVDGEQGLLHVFQAPQHRGHLVHGRGLQGNGFPEVFDEQHQAEGSAALGAVHQGQAGVHAEKGQGGADRLAHFQRIDRAGFFIALDVSHGRTPKQGQTEEGKGPGRS